MGIRGETPRRGSCIEVPHDERATLLVMGAVMKRLLQVIG